MVATHPNPGGELVRSCAALLSSEDPVDVLIDRMCNTIAVELSTTVFMALPDDAGVIRIAHAAGAEPAAAPDPSQIDRAFRGEREPLAAGADSSVYVPIRYGVTILGVLVVGHPGDRAFVRGDVTALETVGRYLGLALHGRPAPARSDERNRYPWFGAILVVLVAVLGTLLTVTTYRTQVASENAHAVAREQTHTRLLVVKFTTYVRNAAALDRAAASVVGPERGDRALAQHLVLRLLRAADEKYIRGIGVFFAPDRGSPGTALSGAYACFHKGRAVQRVSAPPSKALAAARGAVRFMDPYVHRGRTYISAVEAFDYGPDAAGVAMVDTDVSMLAKLLGGALAHGERASILNNRGETLLAAGPQPTSAAERAIADWAIPTTSWTLRLESDRSAFVHRRARLFAMSAAAVVAIWLIASVLEGLIFSAYRARRDAAGLKRERLELRREIVTRIDSEERLRVAAYHDALTGLPNRAFFYDRLGDALVREREADMHCAVLFIDLDRFYAVNDTLGHSAGDLLLRELSQRLHAALPAPALAARLGGDEFGVLLPPRNGALGEAIQAAESVIADFRRPFTFGEREAYISASIGIVVVDETYTDAQSILRDADVSMYKAKRTGGGYVVFDRALRARMAAQLQIETELRGAAERHEIVAHYQPIVRVADRAVIGFEALARWNRPGAGLVHAAEFIPVAERAGILRPIDAAMFECVCEDAVRLATAFPDIRFTVNLSAAEFSRPTLIDEMEQVLCKSGLSPQRLCLEITETAVMEDQESSLAVLERLSARGFTIVIDDFGVGHSSLSYLQRLPVSGLKIDRSFITPLGTGPEPLAILRAIVTLAQTLGLFVVAEGVESEAQRELLQMIGVDCAQGFLFSPALAPEALTSYLSYVS